MPRSCSTLGASLRKSVFIVGVLLLSQGQAEQNYTIRIALNGLVREGFGTNALAGFLAAINHINSDPLTHLGNASIVVEGHVSSELYTPFFNSRNSQRDSMRMLSREGCYSPIVESPGPVIPPRDAHALLQGGFTKIAQEISAVAEFANKPLLTFGATGDLLTNKTDYPMHSRLSSSNMEEAEALAILTQTLGVSRIGVVYSLNEYGQEVRLAFGQACSSRNISVVASVGVQFGVRLMAPMQQKAVLGDFGLQVETAFREANVKVILVAVDGSDVAQVVNQLNKSAVIGNDTIMILPVTAYTIASLPTTNPAFIPLQHLFSGSVGILPIADASAADEMWEAFPKNAQNWTAMLNSFHQTNNLSLPPPIMYRPFLSSWAKYAWDGTILLTKAITRAWTECVVDDLGHAEPLCLLEIIRNTTINGTTGAIDLDSAGDRRGSFGVFNMYNRVSSAVGSVDTLGGATVNFRSITWSDGSTNAMTAPAWGQDTLAPTPAPTVVVQTTTQRAESQTAVITSAVLTLVLMLVGVGAVVRFYDMKRRQLRPADFRKVIERLKESMGNIDFSGNGKESTLMRQLAITGSGTLLNIPSELKRRDVVVEDVLGQGQFGEVCRGRLSMVVGHAKTQVPVAIKTVANDAMAESSFLDEAAVTWQFEHPNVVGMYGVVTSGFPRLLVLELCENGELLKYVRDKDIEKPVEHLLAILKDIAAGMEYLASKNFVHRDVAARNVLLDRDFRAKMCDFGLGRNFDGSDYYRVTSDTLLPIRWTDPWALESHVFSESTDVWSFGVTAIEIFTDGETPYGSWPNMMIIEKVKDGFRLPKPPTMSDEVYQDIVLPCWTHEPKPNESDQSTDDDEARAETRVTYDNVLKRPKFEQLNAALHIMVYGDAPTDADDESEEGSVPAVRSKLTTKYTDSHYMTTPLYKPLTAADAAAPMGPPGMYAPILRKESERSGASTIEPYAASERMSKHGAAPLYMLPPTYHPLHISSDKSPGKNQIVYNSTTEPGSPKQAAQVPTGMYTQVQRDDAQLPNTVTNDAYYAPILAKEPTSTPRMTLPRPPSPPDTENVYPYASISAHSDQPIKQPAAEPKDVVTMYEGTGSRKATKRDTIWDPPDQENVAPNINAAPAKLFAKAAQQSQGSYKVLRGNKNRQSFS